jgi:hypothetical protein
MREPLIVNEEVVKREQKLNPKVLKEIAITLLQDEVRLLEHEHEMSWTGRSTQTVKLAAKDYIITIKTL